MKHVFALPLAAVFLAAQPADAQQNKRFTVAVVVEEDSTSSVLASAFRGAFRSLGDVDLVGVSEDPEFVLSGVAMCMADLKPADRCSEARFWVVSIAWLRPLRYPALMGAIDHSGQRVPAADTVRAMQEYLSGYTNIEQLWVLSWGKTAYSGAVSRLVAEIDSGCLDGQRLIARIAQEPSPERRRQLADAYRALQPNRC